MMMQRQAGWCSVKVIPALWSLALISLNPLLGQGCIHIREEQDPVAVELYVLFVCPVPIKHTLLVLKELESYDDGPGMFALGKLWSLCSVSNSGGFRKYSLPMTLWISC